MPFHASKAVNKTQRSITHQLHTGYLKICCRGMKTHGVLQRRN